MLIARENASVGLRKRDNSHITLSLVMVAVEARMKGASVIFCFNLFEKYRDVSKCEYVWRGDR